MLDRISSLWTGLCIGVVVGYFGTFFLLVRDEATAKSFAAYLMPVFSGGLCLAVIPELIRLCAKRFYKNGPREMEVAESKRREPLT